MTGEMDADFEALITKGRRSLAAARRLQDAGDPDFAASRAYYAMFYLAEALLLSLPHRPTFVRHSGVVAAIRQEFVRTGKLRAEHQEALQRAMEDRNAGDYQYREILPPERAARVLRDAEAFVAAAEAYLRGSA